jgi:hypothetical protein
MRLSSKRYSGTLAVGRQSAPSGPVQTPTLITVTAAIANSITGCHGRWLLSLIEEEPSCRRGLSWPVRSGSQTDMTASGVIQQHSVDRAAARDRRERAALLIGFVRGPRRRTAGRCGVADLMRVNIGMLPSDERLSQAAEFTQVVACARDRATAA